MHVDELRQAVDRISDMLVHADLRSALAQFRGARDDDCPVAAARVRQAGALVMERFERLSPAEQLVVRSLHLQDLSRLAYWDSLMHVSADPKAVAAELVRLTRRVVFVTGQLPGLVSLLDTVDDELPVRLPVGATEARLVVRLADAGERACDPDRIARSIDGIDMLYSACASLARTPVMDLRLEAVNGVNTRDIHLTGERDAVAAVVAVLDSIPELVASIDENDEDADINLDELVRTLPVFEDLATLGRLSSFSETDLRDISHTLHQGALLVLESGVVLVPSVVSSPGPVQPAAARPGPHSVPLTLTTEASEIGAAGPPAAGTVPTSRAPERPSDGPPTRSADRSAGGTVLSMLIRRPGEPAPTGAQTSPSPSSGAGGDRHHADDQYERESRRRPASGPRPAEPHSGEQPHGAPGQDRAHQDSVEALLKALVKARDGR